MTGDSTGHLDLLGPIARAPRAAQPRWLPALVGAAALAIAATGTAAAVAIGGAGGQPEDVLPADALGIVKVDFDPGARQKLALFQLGRRFPALKGKLTGADNLRDDALRALFSDTKGISYDADVKPWIGGRAAVAALPSRGSEPDVVVAVQYTDRDKAQAGLAKAERSAPSDSPLAHAFVGGSDYVLVGERQTVVDRAAKARRHLADESAYADAVDELDGDQLLLMWADAARAWAAVPREQRDRLAARGSGGRVDPSGQLVAGVHATGNAIEVAGVAVRLHTGLKAEKPVAGRPVGDLLSTLPSDTVLAAGLGGLAEALNASSDSIDKAIDGLPEQVRSTLSDAGVRLPEDLATLAGDEDAIAVTGTLGAPHLAVRTRTSDPAKAADVAQRLLRALGQTQPGTVQRTSDGIVLGTDAQTVQAVARGGDLGRQSRYREALPTTRGADLVLYADLARALGSAPLDGEARDNARPFAALGMTVTGGSDGRFRLRVTFR